MTEAQAREKRCCGPEGCGTLINSIRLCTASTCMAWQWKHEIVTSRMNIAREGKKTDSGYCGYVNKSC